MKTKILLLAIIAPLFGHSQSLNQYFDGADTSVINSIFIQKDTSASNIWEIGSPQKIIFDQAATQPNVIVTDLDSTYPSNNISSFSFSFDPQWFGWGILAVQWKQKLDFDKNLDGGVIEFTIDGGNTWNNIFDNPFVYNLYGFQTENMGSLADGTKVFTGTDSLWRDIWLCFDNSWLSFNDSMTVRFTSLSDSIDTQKEGWMIDNLMARITFTHTLGEAPLPDRKYFVVYPNPTNGIVNIEARKINDFHIIEKMELINAEGRIVDRYQTVPTKFHIDISNHPSGIYYLIIQTNLKTETFRLVLQND